jgi:hypothetical protein
MLASRSRRRCAAVLQGSTAKERSGQNPLPAPAPVPSAGAAAAVGASGRPLGEDVPDQAHGLRDAHGLFDGGMRERKAPLQQRDEAPRAQARIRCTAVATPGVTVATRGVAVVRRGVDAACRTIGRRAPRAPRGCAGPVRAVGRPSELDLHVRPLPITQ